MRVLKVWPERVAPVVGIAALAVLSALLCPHPGYSEGLHSITSPDTDGSVGATTSLMLDDFGNPVVAYSDIGVHEVRVLHCNDPNCSGGDESITSPDAGGGFKSLALDGNGNPVISYLADQDLMVMYCNDPDCSGADESIAAFHTDRRVGLHTSLALDANGYPVVSFHDGVSPYDLKVLHCNDPNCSGDDESITSPDVTGVASRYSSLALDSAGHPVVGYYDWTNGALRVLHCNDPNCSGGDESIAVPDPADGVGSDLSLALDALGYPVVAYRDWSNEDVKVMHCNDPNCSGGDESITSHDTDRAVGQYISLVLDASGYPVVSYEEMWPNWDLRVMHCNDPNCSGGDESIVSPDTDGPVGSYTSLALDPSGNPVVSYFDQLNLDLKVLHCSDPNCSAKPTPTATPCGPEGCPTPTPTPTASPTATPCPPEGCPTPTSTATATPCPAGVCVDFSLGADVDGDTVDDCGTGVAEPPKCSLSVDGKFAVRVYLNGLPSGVSSYLGFDIWLEYDGVTSKDNPDTGVWPNCVYSAHSVEAGALLFGCATSHTSTYDGIIGTTDFNCPSTPTAGTISMVHGLGRYTELYGPDGRVYAEGEGTTETLTINCVEPAPTPTVPPIGGVGAFSDAMAPNRSSGSAGGVVLVALAAATAGAIALGGAASYGSRRVRRR